MGAYPDGGRRSAAVLAAVMAAVSAAVMIASAIAPGSAASASYCPGHPELAAAPEALEPQIAAAFGVPHEAARNASIRCVGGKLLACIVGANLNCDKADPRRALPGATAFCRDNPNAEAIPMSATGHATIYAWSCAGGRQDARQGRPAALLRGQLAASPMRRRRLARPPCRIVSAAGFSRP